MAFSEQRSIRKWMIPQVSEGTSPVFYVVGGNRGMAGMLRLTKVKKGPFRVNGKVKDRLEPIKSNCTLTTRDEQT